MERDFPIDHPAACDYSGAKYTPPSAPWTRDYSDDHPARGGKNTSEADTPDGMRKLTVQTWKDNAERMRQLGIAGKPSEPQPQPQVDSSASTTITITGEVQATAPER